jgi:hypothetical protein
MKTRLISVSLIVAIAALLAVAKETKESSGTAPTLKVHPKVFNLITSWVSDSEEPVVTEINLDAVEKNGNEFNDDDLVADGEWTRAKIDNGGFMRYRVLSGKGNQYKIEYQENGGGSLTAAAMIEASIEKRDVRKDGKPVSLRVLRVLGISSK